MSKNVSLGIINSSENLEKLAMETKLSELTVSKFTQIIEDVIERKLSDLLRDPDEGLELQPEFEQRLRMSLAHVKAGGKTLSLEEITTRLEGE